MNCFVLEAKDSYVLTFGQLVYLDTSVAATEPLG